MPSPFRFHLALFLLLGSFLSVAAQEPQPRNAWAAALKERTPANLAMSSSLYQIGRFQRGADREAVLAMIRGKRLAHRADGKLQVEVVFGRDDTVAIDPEHLRNLGLEVNVVRKNRADGWLEPKQLIPFAARLGKDYFVSAVTEETGNNQGPSAMNSSGYKVAGSDGTGIKVAFIDGGYASLTAVANAGGAPVSYTAVDFTDNGLQSGTNVHGTGCVESVYDHAPGASYYIYKISGGTQFQAAVDHAIDNDVDVITCSLGPHNTGWDDNSGPYNAAVIDALDAGMLFFTTAGNEAKKHWQGSFDDSDGDNWHQWSGTEERNFVTVAGNDSKNNSVSAWLQWDGSPDDDDYDFYLMDSNDEVLDSSIASSGFETLSWTNDSEAEVDVYLAVYHYGGNTPEFEVFIEKQGLTHAVAASSVECPSNVTHPNAISVGAVHRNDYPDPPGDDPLTSYSSHGPTNSGNQCPDICAATSTTTLAYGGDFSGTSCAAPNAAGAAVAFWSEHQDLSATGVRQILFRFAELQKDWGDPGIDYQYGHGGLFLDDYHPNTHYVYRSGNNVLGFETRAYYNMQQADAAVPVDARVLFLGQTYPAPPSGTLITKKATYRSLKSNALVD